MQEVKKTTIQGSENITSEMSRNRAQKINFAKVKELLQRNINKTSSKTFIQYTKDMIKTYLASPSSNVDNIREVSRFLVRNCMVYKKMIYYYSTAPLFLYSVTQENDLNEDIDIESSLQGYTKVLKKLNYFNMKKEFYNVIATAIRDGISVNYVCDDKNGHIFLMPLDPQYCRIYGKTVEGEWIVYMDASFFDKGNNKDYIYGMNNDGIGVWDETIFKNGYESYKDKGRDFQYFRLPPEKTLCLVSGTDDEFEMPLPMLSGIFVNLLDLLDLEQILADRTELENYLLLISKIPLMTNSEDVDDFAISLELAQMFNSLLEEVVPNLCGVAYSPMDIDVVKFDKSNATDNIDKLAQSYNNLFNNAGMSQLVVAGGASTNSIGLNHALENDMSTVWIFVDRLESWMNFYIAHNMSKGYKFKFHQITWYNRDNYISNLKDAATLGGDPLGYFVCSSNKTPYDVINEARFNSTVLKLNQWLTPLESSYTQSSSSQSGAPTKDESDLTNEGLATRDGNKNDGTALK